MEEKMNNSKLCPTCGIEMVLEVASYPMGSAFLKNRFHVDIYRCPKCDRVKLFAAKSNLVTCPVCGTTHHAGEHCVNCALNSAFDGKAQEKAKIAAPKKHKEKTTAEETGVGQVEAGFLAEPEMTLVEELNAIRYAASPKEIDEDLEKVEQAADHLS